MEIGKALKTKCVFVVESTLVAAGQINCSSLFKITSVLPTKLVETSTTDFNLLKSALLFRVIYLIYAALISVC